MRPRIMDFKRCDFCANEADSVYVAKDPEQPGVRYCACCEASAYKLHRATVWFFSVLVEEIERKRKEREATDGRGHNVGVG